MNTVDEPSLEENWGIKEFLNAATDNLAALLERDSEYEAGQVDAVVNRLPRTLLEAARVLARCEAQDWPADVVSGSGIN